MASRWGRGCWQAPGTAACLPSAPCIWARALQLPACLSTARYTLVCRVLASRPAVTPCAPKQGTPTAVCRQAPHASCPAPRPVCAGGHHHQPPAGTRAAGYLHRARPGQQARKGEHRPGALSNCAGLKQHPLLGASQKCSRRRPVLFRLLCSPQGASLTTGAPNVFLATLMI